MNRKIHWDSGLLQEIGLVYEKAEENNTAGKMLEQLEDKALSECRAICAAGAIKNVSGEAVTPRQFEDSPDEEKEELICQLARLGLAGLDTDIASATITVRLSSLIQRTMACTFFDLMNRLENLDGSLNVLIPKWTLELQAPLGGKKGLMQWELMIMTFYPWLSVREVSTNEEALPPYPDVSTQGSTATKSAPKQESTAVKSTPKQESAQPEPATPYDGFYAKMKGRREFLAACEAAEGELVSAIAKGQFSVKYQGEPLTVETWKPLPKSTKFSYVIAMGGYSITESALICVDFADIFPWCIAITLLYMAENGKKKQGIDAGDDGKIDQLVVALNALHSCCDGWECTILSPELVTIGGGKQDAAKAPAKAAPQPEPKKEPVKAPEKKSFWKRLFG